MDDENMKKAKQASNMVMFQNKAKEYQNKINELQNKEYQGKFQGITIKMKGDFTVIDVRIDQGFYETAGKGQVEKAVFSLVNNLTAAIKQDQEDCQRLFQGDLERMQKEILSENGNNQDNQ